MTVVERLKLVREEVEAYKARVADTSAELTILTARMEAKTAEMKALERRIALLPEGQKPCSDCGAPVTLKSTRCKSCEHRLRWAPGGSMRTWSQERAAQG